MYQFNSSKGITLIELIVVVVIISVIASLAISKISNASTGSKIDALHITAKTLAAGIRQAEINGVTSLNVTRNATYGNFTDSASAQYLTTSLGNDLELWVEGASESPATLTLGSGGDDFIIIHTDLVDHDQDIAGNQVYLKFDRKGNYIGSGTVATGYNTTFTKA